MPQREFSDNCLVGCIRQKSGSEVFCRRDYFRVDFQEFNPEHSPWIVSIGRYSVPGRYDLYNFDYAPSPCSGVGDRVRYFTDTKMTMPKALAQLHRDLNKPEVVKLLVEAVETRGNTGYARDLLNLLACIGRDTKSYRAANKAYKKRLVERQQELDRRERELQTVK